MRGVTPSLGDEAIAPRREGGRDDGFAITSINIICGVAGNKMHFLGKKVSKQFFVIFRSRLWHGLVAMNGQGKSFCRFPHCVSGFRGIYLQWLPETPNAGGFA
ncbi:MAG: hypothetical protein IJJ33_07020 [Victivallales bacterium]|nr:hypothetical protein [Victivallales bacterium]